MNQTAILSSKNGFTSFSVGDTVIRFKTSLALDQYKKILRWDNGYIVVETKYKNMPKDEEEYIDLIPILKNLYFDAEEFLKPITRVEIEYA